MSKHNILALEAQDLLICARLALAAVSYRVLYGTHEERLAHALHAIESLLPRTETNIFAPTLLSGRVKTAPGSGCVKNAAILNVNTSC